MSVQLDVTIDDLDVGAMRSVRVTDDDRAKRLLLVRTSTGIYALDHACPHEGYGLTPGPTRR